MHRFILFIRSLRDIYFFKHTVRFLVISLMLLGSWVATRDLDIPPEYELNDKLIHVIVFFCFAVLVDLSTARKPFWLYKGLPLLVYGACIEIMQYFTPDRSFSLLDWVADLSGILLYFVIKRLLVWHEQSRIKVSLK
ncbi:MAG: VanZ family protein [Cocleimonas sp.]|nr:VanZ family protein [Cocleimonas sp.]